MGTLTVILLCGTALVAGAAVAYFLSSRHIAALKSDLAALAEQLGASKSENMVLRSKNEMLEASKAEDEARFAAARAEDSARFEANKEEERKSFEKTREEDKKNYSEALSKQQEKFDETVAKMTAQLKTATEEMLKQRQQEFSASSKENIGQVVMPLKETIEKMKQALNDTTLKQTEMSGDMKVRIEDMMKHSEAARKSADELAYALRHKSKVQGDWGETVLDELLASQGLTKGVHYSVQETLRDSSGKTVSNEGGRIMRPAVILLLDTTRDVIIDSKVSLSAFLDYVNAENDEDRKRALANHVASLNGHVNELSKKDYSSYVKAPKVRMDYVIMFVPNSAALWTAMEAQPDLWRNAMKKNVYIADEQTLYAALRIIDMTWMQIAQAQNQEKVFELANEMLDRVGQFVRKYDDIGSALERAQKVYDEGRRKLEPTGQSITTTCRKLTKLGAKTSIKNPIPQLAAVDAGDEEL